MERRALLRRPLALLPWLLLLGAARQDLQGKPSRLAPPPRVYTQPGTPVVANPPLPGASSTPLTLPRTLSSRPNKEREGCQSRRLAHRSSIPGISGAWLIVAGAFELRRLSLSLLPVPRTLQNRPWTAQKPSGVPKHCLAPSSLKSLASPTWEFGERVASTASGALEPWHLACLFKKLRRTARLYQTTGASWFGHP